MTDKTLEETATRAYSLCADLENTMYKLRKMLTVIVREKIGERTTYIPNISIDNIKPICFNLFSEDVLQGIDPNKIPLKITYSKEIFPFRRIEYITVDTILTKDNIKEVLSK